MFVGSEAKMQGSNMALPGLQVALKAAACGTKPLAARCRDKRQQYQDHGVSTRIVLLWCETRREIDRPRGEDRSKDDDNESGSRGHQLGVATAQDMDLFNEDMLPRIGFPKNAAYYERMAPRSDYGTGGDIVPCASEPVCVPSLWSYALG